MHARATFLTLVLWLLTGCGQPPDSLRLVQGPVGRTGNPTDVALVGRGFLLLSGVGSTALTRRGQLSIDHDGFLVAPGGLRVQGYAVDDAGVRSAVAGDLRPSAAPTIAPRATTVVTLKGNLAADAALYVWPPWFDPENPFVTSNVKVSVQVFDASGSPHALEVYLRKTAEGMWDFHVLSTLDEPPPGDVPATVAEVATGTLEFDTEGNLVSVTQTSGWAPLGVPSPLYFDFGDAIAEGGSGSRGFTQYGGTMRVSTTTFIGQDGYGLGAVDTVQLEGTGEVVGHSSNGLSRLLGQIGVALVPRPEELSWTCGHLALLTPGSGAPVLDLPGAGGRAILEAGDLEVLPPEPDGCDGP